MTRPGPALAALAAGALLAAGCSARPAAAPYRPARSGLAYAACMRAHGLPQFPDPSASGAIVIKPSSGLDQDSAHFAAAQRACRSLAPAGTFQAAVTDAAEYLRFSVCMHQHGFPDFPEPKIIGDTAELLRPAQDSPDAWAPGTPRFVSAWDRCGRDRPGGGLAGPPPDGPAAPPPTGSSGGAD